MKLMKGDSYYAGYECARNGGKNAGWFGTQQQCDEYGEGMRDFYTDQRSVDNILQQDIKACTTVDTTAQQFESLALKQLEWCGEGLPPVGIKCLTIGPHGDDSWYECTILAHTEFSGKPVAVFQYGDTITHSSAKWFKPLAKEADRKREDILRKLTDAICGDIPDVGMASAYNYAARAFDAIAAGKILGLKLEVSDE